MSATHRQHAPVLRRRPLWRQAIATAALCGGLLAGCGGGGGGNESCGLTEQQSWLNSYLHDWYYFNTQIQDPAPTQTFDTIDSYFEALLVRKTATGQDLDRWSNVQDTVSYNQFFGEGKTLGYGVAVAGQTSDPLPLRIRDVAPGSPADLAGLARGMVVDSINGQDGASLKSSGQLNTVLSTSTAGTTLTLQIRDGVASPVSRQITLTAAVYDLTPVGATRVFTSATGRKVGYLFYRTFIDGSRPSLQTSLAQLAAAGVQELILDLRYNGGGVVNVSRDLASAIGGVHVEGRTYAALQYNATHQNSNRTVGFLPNANDQPGLPRLNLPRVYVLTGVRTCSASELVINGLQPFVTVVQVGTTTCGKPYGFNPVERCGNTYSAVNFTSVNALGAGGYINGITPACSVNDDFDHALGDPAEALGAAALQHIDTGSCPASANSANVQALGTVRSRPPLVRDGEALPGMVDR